jgi:2-iminobutanoate/2-iminopropanoate deaminase
MVIKPVKNQPQPGGIMKKTIQTDNAPKAIGPYSQAVSFENLIFTSGQIAIHPASGKIVHDGIEEQTRQVMANLKAILKAAGSDLTKVLKSSVFLNDINDFSRFNEVYSTYFPENPPARSTFQVSALPMGAKVEVEMIAAL